MAWRTAPITIWLFIALMLVTLAVASLPGDPTIENWPVALFLTGLWSWLLLRQSRGAWWVLVALYTLALLVLTAVTVWPWNAALTTTIVLVAASLGVLLAPQTRTWVNVGRTRQSSLA